MKKYVIVMTAAIAIVCIPAISKTNSEAAKEKLGEALFFDPILSKDSTVSCASCHKPDYAFADTSAVSIGVDRKKRYSQYTNRYEPFAR